MDSKEFSNDLARYAVEDKIKLYQLERMNTDQMEQTVAALSSNQNLRSLEVALFYDYDLHLLEQCIADTEDESFVLLQTIIFRGSWSSDGHKVPIKQTTLDAVARSKSIRTVELSFNLEVSRDVLSEFVRQSDKHLKWSWAVLLWEQNEHTVTNDRVESPLKGIILDGECPHDVNIVPFLSRFSFPDLQCLVVRNSLPNRVDVIENMLNESEDLREVCLGPVGRDQGPSQSSSAVWWTGPRMGPPEKKDLGVSFMKMVATSIRNNVSQSTSPLHVALMLCDLDDETAGLLGDAFKTHHPRRSCSLTLQGGGLGYAMRCGMDYHSYTDVRPILRCCFPWVTGLTFEWCIMNGQEWNMLLDLLSGHERLQSLQVEFQADIDPHLFDKLMSTCASLPTMERVSIKYRYGTKKLEFEAAEFDNARFPLSQAQKIEICRKSFDKKFGR